MSIGPVSLGSELLQIRKELGLTQREMAFRLYINMRTYLRAEKYHGRTAYTLAARWVRHEVEASREIASAA